jgi:hypothetical protein
VIEISCGKGSSEHLSICSSFVPSPKCVPRYDSCSVQRTVAPAVPFIAHTGSTASRVRYGAFEEGVARRVEVSA